MRALPSIAVTLLPCLLCACGAASGSADRAPAVAGPRLAESGRSHRGGLALDTVTVQAARRAPRQLARTESADDAAPRAVAPAAGTAASQGAREPERLIVRSAFLRLERRDPEEGAKAAVAVAKRLGGWVQRSDNTSAVLMVPAASLDAALEELAKLGKLHRKDVRGEDVTEEYLDVRIRLDNLERSRLRYLELLAKAGNVTETLAVEKELERITVEIERLKGRLAFLGRVVRHSTIHVVFRRPVSPGPVGWVFYILYHGVKWLFVWD